MKVLLQVYATLSAMRPAMPLTDIRETLGPDAPPLGFSAEAYRPQPGGGGAGAPAIEVQAEAAEAVEAPQAPEKKRGFWGGMQQVGCRARDVWVL